MKSVRIGYNDFTKKGGSVFPHQLFSPPAESYEFLSGTIQGAGVKRGGGGGYTSTPQPTPTQDGGMLVDEAYPYDINNPKFQQAMKKFANTAFDNVIPRGSDQARAIADRMQTELFASGTDWKNDVAQFIDDLTAAKMTSEYTGGKITKDNLMGVGQSLVSGLLAGVLGDDNEFVASIRPDTEGESSAMLAAMTASEGIGRIGSKLGQTLLSNKFGKGKKEAEIIDEEMPTEGLLGAGLRTNI